MDLSWELYCQELQIERLRIERLRVKRLRVERLRIERLQIERLLDWPDKSLDIELVEMRILIKRKSRSAAAESIAHEALESAKSNPSNQISATA